MSTKKNSKAVTSAAVAATALATRRVGENTMVVDMPKPTMQLDLTIKTDDIVDIMVSGEREKYTLEQERLEAQHRSAVNAHNKATKTLAALAERLVDGEAVDQGVRDLVARMEDFAGEKFGTKIVSVDADTYRYNSSDKKKEDPEVNIDKMKIIGEVRVIRTKGSDVVLRRRIELPFTDTMKDAVKTIEEKAAAVRDVEDKMRDVAKKLADTLNPNGLRMRTKSTLVKAYMNGEISDTRSVLGAAQSTPVIALPCATVPAHLVCDND